MSDEAQAKHYVIHDGTSVHVIEASGHDESCYESTGTPSGGVTLRLSGQPVAAFRCVSWWRRFDTREQALKAAQQADQPLECIVGAP